jgi:hypothetical protein
MIQGQVFKLKAKGPDGQPLWAYRYRLEGRTSERPQARSRPLVAMNVSRVGSCGSSLDRAAARPSQWLGVLFAAPGVARPLS